MAVAVEAHTSFTNNGSPDTTPNSANCENPRTFLNGLLGLQTKLIRTTQLTADDMFALARLGLDMQYAALKHIRFHLFPDAGALQIPNPQRTHFLYAPGFGGTPFSMADMAIAVGGNPHFYLNLWEMDEGSYEQQVRLENTALQIYGENGEEPIIGVGHSLGSLKLLAAERRIRKKHGVSIFSDIVTLGGPINIKSIKETEHVGNRALVKIADLVRKNDPDRERFDEVMDEFVPGKHDAHITAIGSRMDEIVGNLAYRRDAENIEIPDARHMSYTWHRRIHRKVRQIGHERDTQIRRTA